MIQQHKSALRDFASTEAKNQSAREHRKLPFRCELICREVCALRPLARSTTADNDGSRGVLLGDQVNPQSLGLAGNRVSSCPGSPSSSSPTSPRSRCLSAPISLPSVMLREEFYSCCQLIVCARAQKHTHAHSQECPQCAQA